MKADEAPEKIYVHVRANKELGTTWHGTQIGVHDIEYTRTDAFIEKACDAYCKVCKMPNCKSNECKWISDFKGHLETL